MEVINNVQLKIKRVRYKAPFGTVLTTPDDVSKIARELIGHEAQEHFIVFSLDTQCKVIGYHTAAIGGIDNCSIDMRSIFRTAIISGATGIVVSHVHPSGNVKPSNKDIDVTEKIKLACDILDLYFVDHLIVSDKKYYSLRKDYPKLFSSSCSSA